MSEIKAKIGGYVKEIESREQLAEMVRSGQILPHHPVYVPDMYRWAHAEEIPDLVEPLAEAQRRHEALMAELAARPWWKKLWDRLRGGP